MFEALHFNVLIHNELHHQDLFLSWLATHSVFSHGGQKKKKDGCASNYVLLDGCAGFTARMDCEQMWEA